MKVTIILLLLVVACVYASRGIPKFRPDAARHWKEFCGKYQKNYDAEEQLHRYKIFKHNLKIIDHLNVRDESASYGITKFADLSSKEFSHRYLLPNYKPAFTEDKYEPVVAAETSALPDNFDWRDKKAVTPVKDQAQCGSCWAFSTVEEIESQWILKGNAALELSPQQIVDCDKKDQGCNGGDTPTAYEYVISAGGLELDSVYPYKAKNEKCQFNASDVAVKISGWKYVVKDKNETEMLSALSTAGPLSICVDAEPWQHYKNGVLSKCAKHLDHCVQLVGYGVEASTNTTFWTVRNSWGADWGEEGYIRIGRDKNLCGIADEVTVAVI